MGLTQAQIEERRKALGGSDIPAILGVSPWQTAYDVWAAKTGRAKPPAATQAMKAGTMFEVGVLDYAESELGPVERDVLVPHPGGLPIVTRLDGRLRRTGEPVEAKVSGLFGPLGDGWGDAGTDEIPDYCAVQLIAQIMCTDADLGHLSAFLGGRGFVLFHVNRNRDVEGMITEAAEAFWKYVKADTPPPDTGPSEDVAKRIRREPGKMVDVNPTLVGQWLEAKKLALAAKQAEDDAKSRVLAALSDAEGGDAGVFGTVTYFEQTRRAYQVAESTFRVLRVKQPKKGNR